MDWLSNLLTNPDSIAHILLVYSIVIALGMGLGRIKVFGVSLGVTFVLFVGLALNYFGFQVNARSFVIYSRFWAYSFRILYWSSGWPFIFCLI